MKEGDRFGGRAARYAKVSKAALKAGAGMAKASFSSEGEAGVRRQRAAALQAALGGLKGPLMKVAQILGTIPDLVPKEYADAFAGLQADAPPMGPSFVKRRMRAELGEGWEAKFRSFGLEAAAAASLGQVHQAVSLEGKALACKLQYPDMDSVVEADLKQLRAVFALFEAFDRAVDTAEIQKEIADRLREELDYRREAAHIRLFSKILEGREDVFVPEVFDELSSGRLLTMSWLHGERIASVCERASQAKRDQIAINLFHAWYVPFYGYGVLHGDPHLGNYTLRSDGALNLLDFGCVRVFEPALVSSVVLLYRALREGREEDAVEAYKAWGFVNPSKRLVEILNVWAKFVYAPLLEDRAQRVEETNTGAYGWATARKIHEELRSIGGMTVPRVFVFMDRAAVGLGSVFLRLKAHVNWFRLFQDIAMDVDEAVVARRQQEIVSPALRPFSSEK